MKIGCADADLAGDDQPLAWVRMGSYFLPFGLTRAVAWACNGSSGQ